MPRFNGTGPQGKGSMTGRGMGRCSPQNNDGVNQNNAEVDQNNARVAPTTNRFFGWFRNGFGRGNGQGLGRGQNQRSGRGSGRGFWNNN
ncbi:MAG: DUF5320 domain-containing protein [Caldisericia bacterium]|nr:DUF5320 domain-containing protein [Caldisericia bacterium]